MFIELGFEPLHLVTRVLHRYSAHRRVPLHDFKFYSRIAQFEFEFGFAGVVHVSTFSVVASDVGAHILTKIHYIILQYFI
jgi:hypothetical protein